MPASQIIFPTSSDPGTRPQESAGRLINAFVEKAESGAPGQALWQRSPGFRRVAAGSSNHSRGFLDYGRVGANPNPSGIDVPPTQIFWATDDKVGLLVDGFNLTYSVNDLGSLPGTKPVFFGRNNAVIPHALALTTDRIGGIEGRTYKLGLTSAPVLLSTVDGAGNTPMHGATSMCSWGAYFIWSYRDGKITCSELNTLEVNPNSLNIEQGMQVLRVCKFANRLYAFGDKWTGVYRDAATKPFPFLREATIPRGILGTHLVAGWETGWSNELIWVGNDCVVYKLNGYNPVPISSDAVSRDIHRVITRNPGVLNVVDALECFVYNHKRNAFWVITSRYADPGFQWTWEYNASTGQWNERKTDGLNNWRGCQSVFTPQGLWFVGDSLDRSLYKMEDQFFWDDIHRVKWTVESGILTGFPARTVIPRASFSISATDPGAFVNISWSLDGGVNWGIPVRRNIGSFVSVPNSVPSYPTARFHPEIICSGLSRGYGIRYRLEVDGDTWVGLSGGQVDVQPRSP